MKPEEGAAKQIEIYRLMTGKEKLRIVFEMWDAVLAMMRASSEAKDLNHEGIAISILNNDQTIPLMAVTDFSGRRIKLGVMVTPIFANCSFL